MPSGNVVQGAGRQRHAEPAQPILTTDKERFVDDPVAVVVAETVKQAKDAAEA
jgi:carbon-monoxide dehydrogenase large subunit